MAVTTQTPTAPLSERTTRWESLLQTYRSEQEAHRQQTRHLHEHRASLQEQRRFLGEYRQGFHDERVLRQRCLENGLAATPPRVEQDFQQRLKRLQEDYLTYQLSVQDKMRLLHEQREALQALPDHAQREQAFRQLQAEWQDLRQGLREQRHLIAEQRESYRQLQLDLQAQHELLRAEKQALKQRQHERRWQGYGEDRW